MDGAGVGVHPTASDVGSQSAAFQVDLRTPVFPILFRLQVVSAVLLPFQEE